MINSRSWRRLSLWGLCALAILLANYSASTQEVQPLRKDVQSLKGMLEGFSDNVIGPPYPGLPVGFPFDKIAPSVFGIEGLAARGLADVKVDGPALLSFAQNSIRARLRELNVLSEITVAPPGGFEWRDDYPCDTLRVAFLVRAFDLDQGEEKAVAVVVNLVTWKGIEFQNAQGVNECQERPVPPLGGLDDTRFFTANTRGEAMAKSRETILALIDREIVRRLLLTNEKARERVETWIK